MVNWKEARKESLGAESRYRKGESKGGRPSSTGKTFAGANQTQNRSEGGWRSSIALEGGWEGAPHERFNSVERPETTIASTPGKGCSIITCCVRTKEAGTGSRLNSAPERFIANYTHTHTVGRKARVATVVFISEGLFPFVLTRLLVSQKNDNYYQLFRQLYYIYILNILKLFLRL